MATLTAATIRRTDRHTHVDAVVDGELRKSFVIYDGNTRDHENAALIYLHNCGVRICNIEREDWRGLAPPATPQSDARDAVRAALDYHGC